MSNFDLKKFLIENNLTDQTRLKKEEYSGEEDWYQWLEDDVRWENPDAVKYDVIQFIERHFELKRG